MQDTLLHLTPAAFAMALFVAALLGAIAALALGIVLSGRIRARARELADPELRGAYDDGGKQHRRRRSDPGSASPAASSIDRFYVALSTGQIAGVEPRPCRAQDLHELYTLWCTRNGERAEPMWRFATTLRQEYGVTLWRGNCLQGDGTSSQGPISVFWLGRSDQADQLEPWIGNEVKAMADAVATYRAGEIGAPASEQLAVLRHQVAVSRSARS